MFKNKMYVKEYFYLIKSINFLSNNFKRPTTYYFNLVLLFFYINRTQ